MHKHHEITEWTVWQMVEEERPSLQPVPVRFDGFYAVPTSVSKTYLVQYDTNKY